MKLTKGTCLGAWIRTDQKGSWDRYEQALGARLHNVAFFAAWGRPVGLAALRPLASGVPPVPNVNLPYGGSTQQNLDGLLRELDAFARPVIIRYAGEFDRRSIDPSKFILDWNRVRGYVRQRYPLAEFAWAPTGMGLAPWGKYRAAPFWPGSENVDWPAVDGYDTAGNPRSFVEVMRSGVEWFREHAPGKRIAVLETGVTNVGRSDEYRAQWLRDMAAAVAPTGELAEIKLVTYFDSKPPSEPGVDWLLNEGTQAWQAWQELNRSPLMHSRPWLRV